MSLKIDPYFDNITPAQGRLSFLNKDSFTMRIGKTKTLKPFRIVEMPNNKIPILIGRDLIPKLGISLLEKLCIIHQNTKRIGPTK